MTDDDDTFLQRITITIDIAGGAYTHITAAGALLDVVEHLDRDGVQPHWVALEITGPTATP